MRTSAILLSALPCVLLAASCARHRGDEAVDASVSFAHLVNHEYRGTLVTEDYELDCRLGFRLFEGRMVGELLIEGPLPNDPRLWDAVGYVPPPPGSLPPQIVVTPNYLVVGNVTALGSQLRFDCATLETDWTVDGIWLRGIDRAAPRYFRTEFSPVLPPASSVVHARVPVGDTLYVFRAERTARPK